MANPKKPTLVKLANKDKLKESKAETFTRLAKPRVQSVLKAIRILGNCSNRSNYEYTQEQISKIFITISDSLIECEKKFGKSKVEQETFEF